MTNLDSILESRDITLPTKVCLVKAMVFPVVMYGCESWTIKKAESWRIDAFELWCWRRLLRVPWTARRSNQSILKEISPECSSEGLMLKLERQYFGRLMRRTESGKDPDAGKDWRQEEKETTEDELVGWHHRRDGHVIGWTPGVGDGQGGLACCSPWCGKESDTTEWLNWTELNLCPYFKSILLAVVFPPSSLYFYVSLARVKLPCTIRNNLIWTSFIFPWRSLSTYKDHLWYIFVTPLVICTMVPYTYEWIVMVD